MTNKDIFARLREYAEKAKERKEAQAAAREKLNEMLRKMRERSESFNKVK